MGRRSSGGFGGSRRSYSSGFFTPKKSFPKPAAKDEKSPPPAKVEDNTRYQTFTEALGDGFSWGFGNAFGHRFVEAIFGPRTIKQEIVVPEKVDNAVVAKNYSESCSISYKAFEDCLKVEENNLSKCHLFMDSLFECKRNSTSFNL